MCDDARDRRLSFVYTDITVGDQLGSVPCEAMQMRKDAEKSMAALQQEQGRLSLLLGGLCNCCLIGYRLGLDPLITGMLPWA